jgi:malate dehydrogenase (oxaloacetate-decarboxylating)(NADP+)
MIEASSLGLAGSLTPDELSADLLYPRIERIREISALIAMKVIRAAQTAGVDRNPDIKSLTDADLVKFVEGKMWNA